MRDYDVRVETGLMPTTLARRLETLHQWQIIGITEPEREVYTLIYKEDRGVHSE